jgi:hypothetical protein
MMADFIPEVVAWLEQQKKKQIVNPCVKLYGPGPEGAICKTCRHLGAHWTARKFYKCELRTFSRGPATDHRVRWPACGKYEAKTIK